MGIFSFLSKKKRKEEHGDIGGYKINLEGTGFNDIQVGDRFEGCACGHFFTDQTCQSIDGEYVYGTTTLAIFRKENIRPIGAGSPPTVTAYGSMAGLGMEKYVL